MHRLFTKAALLAMFVTVMSLYGFSQLRNISEFSHDRLNPDKTYFILHDSGGAEFGWASEWTAETTLALEGKAAMLLWNFKDGTKAYAKLVDDIGNIGKNMSYLVEGKISSLEDARHKKIQPLTRGNYPVKVELWIGTIDASAGYSPETLGDAVCLDATNIEQNHSYHFAACPHTEH